jgi:hypothetical protein
VYTATATAAAMVGIWAMGPDPLTIGKGFEPNDDNEEVLQRLERIGSTIMNRAGGSGMMVQDPIVSILRNQDKKRAAAQILGQAYVTAYALMSANRAGIDKIADVLVDRKELHGDEVGQLLDSVDLERPELDLMDPNTWPKV